MLKIGVFSPKIVCKSLLNFFQQSQNKFCVTGQVSKKVFLISKSILPKKKL
mgnify:FL=1|jgi:hypothetical protein